jgi:hypothetical protein
MGDCSVILYRALKCEGVTAVLRCEFLQFIKEETGYYIPIYIQQDVTLYSSFISGNCSTCFGWMYHPKPAGSCNGVTNNRCCRYSCMRSS